MIYLRLSGGLGNQLYQLAATCLLSVRLKKQVIPHVGGLQKYKVSRNPDSLNLLAQNQFFHFDDQEQLSIARWFSVSARAGKLLPLFGVNDKNFWRMLNRKNLSTPLFMDGYFQHGWTQNTFAEALRAMPTNPIAASAAARIDDREVLVHIRGGDFLLLPKYQVVDVNFYVQTARAAMAQGRNCFAVMSDDLIYAHTLCGKIREALPEASFRMIPPGASALDDFDTLRAASARIIGNSTFAWWATALGNQSPTWSPTKFTIDQTRDFYLPCEIYA